MFDTRGFLFSAGKCPKSNHVLKMYLFLNKLGGLLSSWGARVSPVVEHRLQAHGLQQLRSVASVAVAPGLQSTDSAVAANGLSRSVTCEVFLDQGLNPCLLHWQVDSSPRWQTGSPQRLLSVIFLCCVLSPVSFLGSVSGLLQGASLPSLPSSPHWFGRLETYKMKQNMWNWRHYIFTLDDIRSSGRGGAGGGKCHFSPLLGGGCSVAQSCPTLCNPVDCSMVLIPGLGRSPGEGKGYPLEYSGLEKSIDYIVHGVSKSWTQLSDFHFTSLHVSIH